MATAGASNCIIGFGCALLTRKQSPFIKKSVSILLTTSVGVQSARRPLFGSCPSPLYGVRWGARSKPRHAFAAISAEPGGGKSLETLVYVLCGFRHPYGFVQK